MESKKKQMVIEKFLGILFHNSHRMLLTNVLFSVPYIILTILAYLFLQATHYFNIFILLLPIFICYPLYAGVTLVTRNLVKGEDDKIKIFKTFFKGVKDNFFKFLLHGFFLYLSVLLSYFSIAYYIAASKSQSFFYVLLISSCIISIAILLASFYIPLMTVTYDLSIKNIYKNSFLMAFGELKKSALSVVGLLLLIAICTIISFLCNNNASFFGYLIILLLLIFPTVPSLIINLNIYDAMVQVISYKDEKIKELDNSIEKKSAEKKKKVDINADEFSDISLEDLDGNDEYIFHNGKMVKKSILKKHLQGNSKNEE